MLRAFVPPETLVHTSPDPFYPEDLLPEAQSVLQALADVEVRYDRELERLNRSSEAEDVKQRLRRQLEERRCRDQEPYVKRLAELQRQMLAISGSRFTCAIH